LNLKIDLKSINSWHKLNFSWQVVLYKQTNSSYLNIKKPRRRPKRIKNKSNWKKGFHKLENSLLHVYSKEKCFSQLFHEKQKWNDKRKEMNRCLQEIFVMNQSVASKSHKSLQ
jgi:hypothetical protein